MAKARWALPVVLWGLLSLCSSEFLSKVEERSFFQFDSLWFREFLNTPAGLLSWCGLFFTQFLHIPWLGALIWVLLLTLSAELTRIVFKISSKYSILTYLPSAIFVAYNMSMGYMVYIMNCPGYFFAPVLGYLWVLLSVVIVRIPQKPLTSLALTILWGLIGYYFAGIYGLAGIVAGGIELVCSNRSRLQRFLPLAGIAVTLLIAPILFLGTASYYLPDGWTIGLPDHIHSVSIHRMQLPVILALLIVASAPLARLFGKSAAKTLFITQIIAWAVVIATPAISWYHDSNFKAELRMIHAIDNLEWEKVPEIFDDLSKKNANDVSWQPTRVMVVLNDLALIKTGQESERAFAFEDGSKEQNRKWDVPMAFQIGRILGLHYGIPGLCQRWCYEEDMLFGWNNNTLKYSAMTAILLRNTELAKKYLGILEHTLNYRKWAKEQFVLCQDFDLAFKTAPYDMIQPLMCYDDLVLDDHEGCETFLKKHFNGISPKNSTPLYDRVALFFAMKSKDATLFWTRFFLYLDSNNPRKIDRSYQEAAYLFSNIEDNEILKQLPYDEQEKKLYNSFVSLADKYGPKKIDEARRLFPSHLRHTYFFYYYYVNNIKMF